MATYGCVHGAGVLPRDELCVSHPCFAHRRHANPIRYTVACLCTRHLSHTHTHVHTHMHARMLRTSDHQVEIEPTFSRGSVELVGKCTKPGPLHRNLWARHHVWVSASTTSHLSALSCSPVTTRGCRRNFEPAGKTLPPAKSGDVVSDVRHARMSGVVGCDTYGCGCVAVTSHTTRRHCNTL
jgi:hypothetical protein